MQVWIALVALALFPGCTVVRIHAQSTDDAKVHWHAGIVSIELAPGVRSVVAESVSVGAVKTPAALAVGYHNSTIAALGEACAVVLWIHSDAQLVELRKLLAERNEVCVVNTKLSQ